MVKTKIQVPYYTSLESKDVLEALIKEKGYPAGVYGGWTYDDRRYATLEVEHHSNFERIKRWKEIENEFYKRDYERMREDYSMLHDLQFLFGCIDNYAGILIDNGNVKDGESIKFYTDHVARNHKALLEMRQEREEFRKEMEGLNSTP